MKREIKFRAWDKVNKIMVVSNQLLHLEFDKDGVNWIGAWGSDYDSEGDQCQKTFQMEKDNFELMQFTGLKDENGKELYEGDVIRFEEPVYEKDILELPVMFLEGEFIALFDMGSQEHYIPLHEIGDFEVIGNIYESSLKEDYPSN